MTPLITIRIGFFGSFATVWMMPPLKASDGQGAESSS